MIRSVTSEQAGAIRENNVVATDGELGLINDVFFDDSAWTVRYLVVHTDGVPGGHETLITPATVSGIERQDKILRIDTDVQRALQAPHLEANLPVAAQQEAAYYDYLGVEPYWTMEPDPLAPPPPAAAIPEIPIGAASGDPHLRSTREVAGYNIETSDGSLGHVEDLLLDDEAWKVRYFVIDTRNWLPAKKVLLPLEEISEIDWALQRVSVHSEVQKIKETPAWDPQAPLDRDYETKLYEHYGQRPYWARG